MGVVGEEVCAPLSGEGVAEGFSEGFFSIFNFSTVKVGRQRKGLGVVPVRKGALGAEEDVGIKSCFGGRGIEGGSKLEERLENGGSLTGLRESEVCAGEVFVSPKLNGGDA